jgi:hypothetical protein
MNVLSEFFGVNLKEKKRVQIRINEAEFRYKPYLYLLRFLLFCEKNMITPNSIRIIYLDSTCSLNDHLIKMRFSDFTSSIYYISAANGSVQVPNIPFNPEKCTIFITDTIKFVHQNSPIANCDLEVSLITSFQN